MYCLKPAEIPEDEDMPAVCAACTAEAESGYKYRVWKADFEKGKTTKVLGVNCVGCGDYIPRSVWPDNNAPSHCYICDCAHRAKMWHDAYGAEIAKWKEEDKAAEPAIIKALQAVFAKK